MSIKYLISHKTKRIIQVCCSIWFLITIPTSIWDGRSIATLFTDLPKELNSVSPIILSMIYLNIFLPALISVVIFSITILMIPISRLIENSPNYQQVNNYK